MRVAELIEALQNMDPQGLVCYPDVLTTEECEANKYLDGTQTVVRTVTKIDHIGDRHGHPIIILE